MAVVRTTATWRRRPQPSLPPHAPEPHLSHGFPSRNGHNDRSANAFAELSCDCGSFTDAIEEAEKLAGGVSDASQSRDECPLLVPGFRGPSAHTTRAERDSADGGASAAPRGKMNSPIAANPLLGAVRPTGRGVCWARTLARLCSRRPYSKRDITPSTQSHTCPTTPTRQPPPITTPRNVHPPVSGSTSSSPS